MSKLSVSIVAYNDYGEIIHAIKSLEEYTSRSIDKKIYVVDNSCQSNEEKKKKFSDAITKYSDVTYIDTKVNLGFGKGHNYILNRIDSEYHCIMNPDILFCEDAFSSIISYLDDNLDVGMVIPNITDEKGERQHVYRKEVTVGDMFIRMFCKKLFPKRMAKHTLQDQDYSKPFQVPFGQGSFLVIRTELLKKLGGFDDHFFMYLEDADLCKRVNVDSKLMYIPNATVIHKWKRESHKSWKLFKIHVSSMNYYFKKWGITWF